MIRVNVYVHKQTGEVEEVDVEGGEDQRIEVWIQRGENPPYQQYEREPEDCIEEDEKPVKRTFVVHALVEVEMGGECETESDVATYIGAVLQSGLEGEDHVLPGPSGLLAYRLAEDV